MNEAMLNRTAAPEATTLFQPDRIHPKAEAHPRILGNVWPEIKKNL